MKLKGSYLDNHDFSFLSSDITILIKEIGRNHYKLMVPKDDWFCYYKKKKQKWIGHAKNGRYFRASDRIIDLILKNKDEWIAETILLGQDVE